MTNKKLRDRIKSHPLREILKYLEEARADIERYYGICALDDVKTDDSGGMGLVKHAYFVRIGYAKMDHARRQLMKYIVEQCREPS